MVYCLLQAIEPDDYYLNQRSKPKLSDKALIAFSLAAEALGIDSERFFKQLPEPLEGCKLSRANRSQICQEDADSSPDYGYCAAEDSRYFGFSTKKD